MTGGDDGGRNRATAFGETWVYESLVGALPGVDLTDRAAIALQVGVFEAALLVLAWAYGLWGAALAGTAAVGVAAVGSVVMLRLGATVREGGPPDAYRRLLFGSSIEVVLAVLAFVALVVHLFVYDPRTATATPTLLASLFGDRPPVLVVYLTLLILWDLCYRIGASWWAAVVGLWRSLRFRFDPATADAMRRADRLNVGFGLAQVLLVPFVLDRPVLVAALSGHVVAVVVVSTAAMLAVRER